jgi:uncharacterized protein (TIGR03083 family)
VDKARYLELLRHDGDALAEAAARDLTARVPSCPDWDVAELVRHTSEVHRHKASVIRAAGQPWDEREQGPSDPEAVLDWYRAGLDDLIELFETTDENAPAKTWGTGTTVGWWIRRMAQETAVHRWDAENAVGDAAPIDPELASDGIDEFLGEFIPGEDIPWDGTAGTIHLHCTDVQGEWTVTLGPGSVPTYETGHTKGDAAVRGAASDLLLFVWRRVPSDAVEVLGDAALVDAFWTYLRGPGQ